MREHTASIAEKMQASSSYLFTYDQLISFLVRSHNNPNVILIALDISFDCDELAKTLKEFNVLVKDNALRRRMERLAKKLKTKTRSRSSSRENGSKGDVRSRPSSATGQGSDEAWILVQKHFQDNESVFPIEYLEFGQLMASSNKAADIVTSAVAMSNDIKALHDMFDYVKDSLPAKAMKIRVGRIIKTLFERIESVSKEEMEV